MGGEGEEILLSLTLSLSPSSFLLSFPLRFIKLWYEKLLLFCNDRKTVVKSNYELKRANIHLTFIGF